MGVRCEVWMAFHAGFAAGDPVGGEFTREVELPFPPFPGLVLRCPPGMSSRDDGWPGGESLTIDQVDVHMPSGKIRFTVQDVELRHPSHVDLAAACLRKAGWHYAYAHATGAEEPA